MDRDFVFSNILLQTHLWFYLLVVKPPFLFPAKRDIWRLLVETYAKILKFPHNLAFMDYTLCSIQADK